MPLRRPHSGRRGQALALTLDPDKFGVCKPLVCRFCNKLFRKFCSDAVEDWVDAVAPAAEVEAVEAALPLIPCTRVLNELSRLEIAGVVDPFDPTC